MLEPDFLVWNLNFGFHDLGSALNVRAPPFPDCRGAPAWELLFRGRLGGFALRVFVLFDLRCIYNTVWGPRAAIINIIIIGIINSIVIIVIIFIVIIA